jgi:hypothetical protein
MVLTRHEQHQPTSALHQISSQCLRRQVQPTPRQRQLKLDPVLIAELDASFSPHSIDRFDSALNTLLPRYNTGLKDPTCEAVDALHLSTSDWRKEKNWCNPSWPLLPNLVQKLRQSGAATTIVAPIWTGEVWHHALIEMTSEELVVAPRSNLLQPGGGRYAVQQAFLTRPSLYSELPPGPALLKTRSYERYVCSVFWDYTETKESPTSGPADLPNQNTGSTSLSTATRGSRR